MTLPYKLALVLATLALVASVVSRLSNREGSQRDTSNQVAVSDTTAEAADEEKPAALVADGSPTRDVFTEPRVSPDVLPKRLHDRAPVPTTEPKEEAGPGPAAVAVDQPQPPTLTVGRDPFARSGSVAAVGPAAANAEAEIERDTEAAARARIAAGATYTVRAGDTFESIAVRQLGASGRWRELAHANPLVDPLKLRIGQVLRLPAESDADDAGPIADAAETPPANVADPALPAPPAAGLVHVVRTGDSLSTIAARYYGDSSRWRAIYDANRDRIGQDPHAVRVGMELRIPPAVPASPQSASR